MSKYTQQLLDQIEKYCIEIKLDDRLVHIPRTKEQADELRQIQFDCEIQYRADYSMAIDDDTINPYRENLKAIKAIRTLIKHLFQYHIGDELEMIAELQQLEKRLDINDRLKPKDVFNSRKEELRARLQLVGFKDTNIDENILPILTDIIKNN